MKKKLILASLVGAFVILGFAFAILLIINSFFPGIVARGNNFLLSLIPFLLAPAAGGFMAGLMSREKPLQAGLFAGLIAGLIVLIAWLVVVGLSMETVLSGLVILFVWVVIARTFSGFSQPKINA